MVGIAGVNAGWTPDLSFSMRLKKLEAMITAINFNKTLWLKLEDNHIS